MNEWFGPALMIAVFLIVIGVAIYMMLQLAEVRREQTGKGGPQAKQR